MSDVRQVGVVTHFLREENFSASTGVELTTARLSVHSVKH